LPGDRVVAIDGHKSDSYQDLVFYLGSALAGTKVRLDVQRAGRPLEFEVTLAKYRNDTPSIASVRPEPVFGVRVDYGSVLVQSPDIGRRSSSMPYGVVVRGLEPDSPAAARFKSLGENNRWVITHVNGAATRTPPEFYKAARGKESIKLTVVDADADGTRPVEMTLP
jgi:S1-C subfamily serine protease